MQALRSPQGYRIRLVDSDVNGNAFNKFEIIFSIQAWQRQIGGQFCSKVYQ